MNVNKNRTATAAVMIAIIEYGTMSSISSGFRTLEWIVVLFDTSISPMSSFKNGSTMSETTSDPIP